MRGIMWGVMRGVMRGVMCGVMRGAHASPSRKLARLERAMHGAYQVACDVVPRKEKFPSEQRLGQCVVRDVAVAVWKKRGYGWEDKLFKVCDASSPDRPIRRFTRQCANATLNDAKYRTGNRGAVPGSKEDWTRFNPWRAPGLGRLIWDL